MKRYIIFAGVNGAGKTTLYQTNPDIEKIPRINVDEIVRGIGSWENTSDVLKAGRVAAGKLKKYLVGEESFNQETTLCGRSILRNMELAKESGFYIEMYYVGLESAELAIARVKQRVQDGGHGIPKEDVIRRYSQSLQQLKIAIPHCFGNVEIRINSGLRRFSYAIGKFY